MWSFLPDRKPNDHELCSDFKLRRVKIREERLQNVNAAVGIIRCVGSTVVKRQLDCMHCPVN